VELGLSGKYNSSFTMLFFISWSFIIESLAVCFDLTVACLRYKAWGSLLAQELLDCDIIVTCIDYRCCLVYLKFCYYGSNYQIR
jgi:hypothetical protein